MSNLTPKQEKFCQKYIETGNASEAYRQSYDCANMKMETINRSAKELLDNHKISTRINELKALSVERHLVTVDSITAELEQARALALNIEQPSAAVSASMGKAKLHGIIVDKSELSGKNGDAIKFQTESDDAIIARYLLKQQKGTTDE
jgi:hypothetical protein